MFFAVLISLLSLTRFIAYPDIINGSARLVSLNAPKMISAKTEGKLVKLFAPDGKEVRKGEHLGYVESTASYNEVMELKQWVE